MNKKLTDEYKKLAENELPDLWDRIEAGINETIADTSEKTGGKTVQTVTDIDFPVEDLKTVKLEPISYQNRYRFVRRYGGLLVACLCVAILVPVIYMNRDFGNRFTANDSFGGSTGASAPAAAPMADTAMVSESTADEAEAIGNMMPEVAYDDADSSKRKESELEQDMDYESQASYGAGDEMPVNDGVASVEDVRERLFQIQSDEKIIEITKVTVEITDFRAAGSGNELSNVYIATVIADETDTLFTGISIFLRESEDLDMTVAVGETYIADLLYWEAVQYFMIVKVW